MIKIETKKVKLSDVELNPDNPRTINKKDMALLIKSLKEFPEMLELREIVVDETMVVLGGNMRTLALKKSGAKECVAKIVSGLTAEQKREFIIKDNGGFGQWDMDALANTWGGLPLADWGVAIPGDWAQPGNTGMINKNFNSGRGEEDQEGEISHTPDKYPVTFTLDQLEHDAWEGVKSKMKLRDDKVAFLKIIGGLDNA